jgi:hypothetical protein
LNTLSIYNKKITIIVWSQWLTPVILATQKDHSSMPATANSSQTYLGKPITEKGWGGVVEWAQGVGSEFEPQY